MPWIVPFQAESGAGACARGPRSMIPWIRLFADDGKDITCREDQVILALDLDLRAPVLRVDDRVADGDVEGHSLSLFESPGADGHDGALLRLLLGRVRDHDAGDRGLLLVARLDDDPVFQGLQVEVLLCHPSPPWRVSTPLR